MIALAGAATMSVGAGVWASTGTDLDTAVTDGNVADYVAAVAASPAPVVRHLSLWMVGAPLPALAAVLIARRNPVGVMATASAEMVAIVSVSVGLAAFTTWMALVSVADRITDPTPIQLAGFIGSRGDGSAPSASWGLCPSFSHWRDKDPGRRAGWSASVRPRLLRAGCASWRYTPASSPRSACRSCCSISPSTWAPA